MTNTNLIERLRQDDDMLQDGLQENLTDAWHNAAMKQAAEDCSEAAALIEQQEAVIEGLVGAITQMIYETTHLSADEPDGSHYAKISAEALLNSRKARITAKAHMEGK